VVLRRTFARVDHYPLEIAHEHRNYLADFGILRPVQDCCYLPCCRLAPVLYTTIPVLSICLFAHHLAQQPVVGQYQPFHV
jgi:hypothetical protein